MRWPWSKNNKEGQSVRDQSAGLDRSSQGPSGAGPDLAEQAAAANAALHRADQDYHRAVSREHEVEKLSSSLRRINQRNQFAAMITETFRRSA